MDEKKQPIVRLAVRVRCRESDVWIGRGMTLGRASLVRVQGSSCVGVPELQQGGSVAVDDAAQLVHSVVERDVLQLLERTHPKESSILSKTQVHPW